MSGLDFLPADHTDCALKRNTQAAIFLFDYCTHLREIVEIQLSLESLLRYVSLKVIVHLIVLKKFLQLTKGYNVLNNNV